jgi:hypothetical protein
MAVIAEITSHIEAVYAAKCPYHKLDLYRPRADELTYITRDDKFIVLKSIMDGSPYETYMLDPQNCDYFKDEFQGEELVRILLKHKIDQLIANRCVVMLFEKFCDVYPQINNSTIELEIAKHKECQTLALEIAHFIDSRAGLTYPNWNPTICELEVKRIISNYYFVVSHTVINNDDAKESAFMLSTIREIRKMLARHDNGNIERCIYSIKKFMNNEFKRLIGAC